MTEVKIKQMEERRHWQKGMKPVKYWTGEKVGKWEGGINRQMAGR